MNTILTLKNLRFSLYLGLIWLLLSGHYEPLMLFFGLASVALVVVLSLRMNNYDKDDYSLIITGSVIKYLFVLAKYVVTSNIDVVARILGFKPVQSQFVTIPKHFKDDLSVVLYANAITLTPGSASIDLQGDDLLVHTISDESAKEIADGEMAKIIPPLKGMNTSEVSQ